MLPFLTKILNGRSAPLSEETRAPNQHLNAVTVVQGNRVTQITEKGVTETRGPMEPTRLGTVLCLTFDTEDGKRFYRTYEYELGKVLVTTSELTPLAPWEDDPELGIAPSRLWHAR